MEYEYYEESSHADIYNLFRPSTPKELVEIIVKYLQEEVKWLLHLFVINGSIK